MYKNERIVTFTGPFANICRAYIQKNRALGYKYNINETYLKQFDSFCIGKVQPGDPITKELFEEWTQKRDYESPASHGIRYKVLAQFCTDLNNNGTQTYIGFHLIKHDELGRGFAPYIFTVDEISRFLSASAEVKPSRWSRFTHLVLPVMFRLLYSSGLRLSEVIMLEISDVDLDAGMLSIRDTKFDKSRKLPMAESMRRKCRKRFVKPNSFFQPRTAAILLNAPFTQDFEKFCSPLGFRTVGEEKDHGCTILGIPLQFML
jgi:integrase